MFFYFPKKALKELFCLPAWRHPFDTDTAARSVANACGTNRYAVERNISNKLIERSVSNR